MYALLGNSWLSQGAKMAVLGSKRPSHKKCPGKVKMAQKWANMHGIIVLYLGRGFGDDMTIPGLL